MLKSIPTDSQFPLLPKCFEVLCALGLKKVECLYLYILFWPCQDWVGRGGGSQFFLLVKSGGCKKIVYDMGEILENFIHLKNILCPPAPHSIHNECSLS